MKTKPLLIGLTGQTGAGKSTVSAYLRQLGYPVIDADLVSRAVVEPGSDCLKALAAAFGEEILLPDGSLNRKRLGGIVFSDREQKARMEALIFPHIGARVDDMAAALFEAGEAVVFLDAPTLFESGADVRCDLVISVIAPEEERRARIMVRDGLSEQEARLRMGAQHEDAFYTDRSGIVIKNAGDQSDLRAQVDAALQVILGVRE